MITMMMMAIRNAEQQRLQQLAKDEFVDDGKFAAGFLYFVIDRILTLLASTSTTATDC